MAAGQGQPASFDFAQPQHGNLPCTRRRSSDAPWSSGRRRGFAVSCLNFSTFQCCEPREARNTIETILAVDETMFPPTKFERATSQTAERPQLHTGSVRMQECASAAENSAPEIFGTGAGGRSIQNNSALNQGRGLRLQAQSSARGRRMNEIRWALEALALRIRVGNSIRPNSRSDR
jgi:hypothetical protein